MQTIQYLKRSEIDEQKWNALINGSVQSLPYSFTWYLDAVAEHWDALVTGDYETVMPLVWLRKLGIKCMYQPYYCQQLGIFSKDELTQAAAKGLIEAAAKKFSYINVNLNPSASVVEGLNGLSRKKNLLLDLNTDYAGLKKKFADNHKRNINKAEKKGLTFTVEVELKKFQKFYIGNVDPEKEKFKTKHEKVFKAITEVLVKEKGVGEVLGIINGKGELVAATLLIHHQGRLIGIINTSSAEGKQQGASHYMFDRVIHKYASTNKVLDFEGSSIPGIARFYEGFGAKEEKFYNYRYTYLKNTLKF